MSRTDENDEPREESSASPAGAGVGRILSIAAVLLLVVSFIVWAVLPSSRAVARASVVERWAPHRIVDGGFHRNLGPFRQAASEDFVVDSDPRKQVRVNLTRTFHFLPWRIESVDVVELDADPEENRDQNEQP